jgi:ABC-type spermidine/putrescine transport system permease subunit II
VVRARLLALPIEAEEAALDLGATPASMVRRVLLPMSVPALIASAAIAFTLSFDNIVLSHWLCFGNDCRTWPGLLTGRGGAGATPDLYAIGTVGMAVTLSMMTVVLLVLVMIRRQERARPRRKRPPAAPYPFDAQQGRCRIQAPKASTS